MKFLIGKKLGMTQIWKDDVVIPVTKISAGPCIVTQVKNKKTDGYEAVQVGYGEKPAKKIKKPQVGHLKNLGNFRYLREFRISVEGLKSGDKITVNTFTSSDIVDVTRSEERRVGKEC